MSEKDVEQKGTSVGEHEVVEEGGVPRTGYQFDPLEVLLRAAILHSRRCFLQGIPPIHFVMG